MSDDSLMADFLGYYQDFGSADIGDAAWDFLEVRKIPRQVDDFLDEWVTWFEGVSASLPRQPGDQDPLKKMVHKAVYIRTRKQRSAEPGRGLVLGSVQSGKTTSYTSLIRSLVEDSAEGHPGPRKFLFVVLTGVHEQLRLQTDARLRRDLADLLGKGLLDFPLSDDVAKSCWQDTKESSSRSSVLTVKKVRARLQYTKELIEDPKSGILDGDRLIVIIDDECDQVTVDTAKQSKKNASRIRELVHSKTAREECYGLVYIGYSATPFANLMLSAHRGDSLFPKDFIYNLPAGEGYQGIHHYFPGDGTFDVASVPAKEVEWRTDMRGKPPMRIPRGSALDASLTWFLVAAAEKRKLSLEGTQAHTSMLIHMYTAIRDHRMVAAAVRRWIEEAKGASDAELEHRAQEVVSQYTGDNYSPWLPSSGSPSAQELRNVLKEGEGVRVIEDHSQSRERLDYTGPQQTVIAVGGHTLSRGLTLHGLVSSYFCRTGDFAYDTFLQFSRWFGYRAGYGHLTRVWMPEPDQEVFRHLGRVEEKLRGDIDRLYREESPDYLEDSVGILVDAAVGMLPSKTLDAMQIIGARIRAETPVQIRHYPRNSPRWRDQDLGQLISRFTRPVPVRGQGILSEGVKAADVKDFLESENTHTGAARLNTLVEAAISMYSEFDVLVPLPEIGTSESSRTFALGDDIHGRFRRKASRELESGVWVPEFTDPKWRDADWSGRTGERCRKIPLLIAAPLEVGPDGNPWDDVGVALVFPEDVTAMHAHNPTAKEALQELKDAEEEENVVESL